MHVASRDNVVIVGEANGHGRTHGVDALAEGQTSQIRRDQALGVGTAPG